MKIIVVIAMLALLASHVIAQTEPPQLGRVLIEYWTGIPYSSVDDLTSSPNYPLKPNSREYSTVMEIPQNLAVNSGDRLRGLFYVPANGTSTFYIASDNASQLWFSTDNNPTHATEIASVAGSTGYQKWTAYSTQKSISYNLTAGQVCYIESRHKQGSGGAICRSVCRWEQAPFRSCPSPMLRPTMQVLLTPVARLISCSNRSVTRA